MKGKNLKNVKAENQRNRKRLVLITSILVIGTAYYFIDHNPKLLLNSSILAPVFWTWILKPICKKLDIDYKKIDDVM